MVTSVYIDSEKRYSVSELTMGYNEVGKIALSVRGHYSLELFLSGFNAFAYSFLRDLVEGNHR
jgi:hypothetical protein